MKEVIYLLKRNVSHRVIAMILRLSVGEVKQIAQGAA